MKNMEWPALDLFMVQLELKKEEGDIMLDLLLELIRLEVT